MNAKPAISEMPVPLPGAHPETGQWRSVVSSLGLHLALLLAFFGFTYSTGGGGDSVEPDRSAGIVLTVQAKPTEEQQYLDQTDFQPSESNDTLAEASTSQPTQDAAPVIEADLSPTKIDMPGFEFNAFGDASQMASPAARGLDTSHELSDAAKELIEADRRRLDSLKPAGPATSLSVFGSGQMEGRSFLFLLDRSTSMGSKGLGVVQVARKELTAAVEKLDSHHRFQILGYNNRTTPMKAPRLLNASKEHKLDVPKFVSNLTAFGPTNHVVGIMTALSYKPDVIVMLTDGGAPGLDSQELQQIRRIHGGRTQIHCVQFGLGPKRLEDEFMETLAGQNGGTFRYIDVGEWEQR